MNFSQESRVWYVPSLLLKWVFSEIRSLQVHRLVVNRDPKFTNFVEDYKEKPDYGRCVAIVASASLREMIKPGALAVLSPIFIGILFRVLGYYTGHPLLGAKVVAAMLMFATVSGILMALFLNTAGGAWDNAKKYIETGALGGKGSDSHKAAITGDIVGDPFKDTAGPSLHVLIKMLATITLVMAAIFL